jgi:hypothetical protein
VEYESDHEARLWPDRARGSTTWLADEILARDSVQRLLVAAVQNVEPIPDGDDPNWYEPSALAGFMLAAASIEALVNELFMSFLAVAAGGVQPVDKALNGLERLDVRTKLLVLPKLVLSKEIPEKIEYT